MKIVPHGGFSGTVVDFSHSLVLEEIEGLRVVYLANGNLRKLRTCCYDVSVNQHLGFKIFRCMNT